MIIASFDGEEPPYCMTAAMGSEHFARNPVVPLASIDLMVCMDLVGHTLGGAGLPAEIHNTLFALGAERSVGTSAELAALARSEPGVLVRPIDAEAIPPLSDYHAFAERQVPFLFLTAGRSRVYHTPEDVPMGLAYPKMAATARWLERLVRSTCARPESPLRFLSGVRDDASTLRTLQALLGVLAPRLPAAAAYVQPVAELLKSCDPTGRLPEAARLQSSLILSTLESALR